MREPSSYTFPMLTFINGIKVADYISYAIGFLAIVATVFIYQRTKKVFRLEYVIDSANPVLTKHGQSLGPSLLGLVVNGQEIENATLIRLRVTNSGNQPVRPSDFYEPIHLHLEGTERILSVDIKETSVNPELSLKATSVDIEPCLLNRNDEISLLLLAEGGNVRVATIKARIAGIEKIAERKKSDKGLLPIAIFINTLILIVAAFAGSAAKQISAHTGVRALILPVIATVGSLVVGLLLGHQSRR